MRAYIDPELDLSTNSIAGQFRNITARQLALAYQAIQIIYNSMNPDAAEGVLLDNICKLTGVIRQPASYSTVTINCNFQFSGVILETDVFFVVSTENPTQKVTPLNTYTSTGSGIVPVIFRCDTPGAIDFPANTLINIATPTPGLLSVAQPNAAVPGSAEESDVSLRARRAESVTIVGAGTVDAITSDILALNSSYEEQNGGYVVSARVYEATTVPTTEVELAHSVKCVIETSPANVASNSTLANAIAQAIWDTKPAGIAAISGPNGNDGYYGTAIDSFGIGHTVYFDSVIPYNIDVIFTCVYIGSVQPSIPDTENAIRSFLNNNYQVGENVTALFVKSSPLQVNSTIVDVSDWLMTPDDTSNITIDFNQRATFNSITVQFIKGDY